MTSSIWSPGTLPVPLAVALALPSGGSLVGLQPEGPDADATTVQTAARRHFIDGDAYINPSYSAATNTARWALLIAYILTLPGGAEVRVSKGTYLFNGSIQVCKKLTIIGEVRRSTIFSFSNTDDGIQSTWPIDSSTAVWVSIRDLAVVNTSGANTGGGFVDVGGSFISLYNVYLTGWKHQIIFDQTEVSVIDFCETIAPSGGSGIWLVNGDAHTVGADKGFTNLINVTNCQLNAAAGALANILDDGGVNHNYRGNNFNAGVLGLRAAGVIGLDIEGNGFEGHSTGDILLTDTTEAGVYVGPCSAFGINKNTLSSAGATYNLGMSNAVNGKVTCNSFGQAVNLIDFLNGASNQVTGVLIECNTKLISGAGTTAAPFITGASRSIRMNQIKQTAVTYSVALSASGTVAITPATMEFITVGSRLSLANLDGTHGEDVTVTAVTGATFTATLATTKTAGFSILGATPADQEEGLWPSLPVIAGSGVAGVHTYSLQFGQYSRRGNQVYVRGEVVVSAKDVLMAGSISILNLPFASEGITNGISFANIALYDGFTLAGGYTHLSGSISSGATAIGLRKSGSGLAISTVPDTDIPGATISIYFEATYLTSAN